MSNNSEDLKEESEVDDSPEEREEQSLSTDGERPKNVARPLHPNALTKRVSTRTLQRQARDRRFLFALNVMTTFLFVGASLGFGPMQLMLEENGSYSKVCADEEREEGVVCEEQKKKLLSIALLIPATQLLSPILGIFVDGYGATKTSYYQAAIFVFGLGLIILAAATLIDPLLYVGFAGAALSTWLGSQLIVQLGLYFEGHQISRAIFVLNTFFDAGKITYLILWFISTRTGGSASAVLGGYLALGLLCYGASCYFWTVAVKANTAELDTTSLPSSRYSRYESLVSSKDLQSRLENNISTHLSSRFFVSTRLLEAGLNSSEMGLRTSRHSRASLKSSLQSKDKTIPEENQNPKVPISHLERKETGATAPMEDSELQQASYELVADRPPKEQLRSAPFLLLCLFFGLNVGMTNWNTATQKDFLNELGDDDKDHLYLTIFTLLAPVSILGAPLIDAVILNFGWTVALQSINVLGISYMTIKVASENLNVQVVGFVIFSFFRSFLFGISFSFLPTLINGNVVGRAAGIMAGAAGLTSALMIPLMHVTIRGEELNFFIPNVVLLSVCLPTTVIVCFIGRYIRLENEAKAGHDV